MSEVQAGTVGFIGVGRMGTPMVTRLVQAGYSVRAFDLSPAAREQASAAGATVADDLPALWRTAPVVILMLPDSAAVSAVLRDDAARQEFRHGRTVIDMSSSEPGCTRELAGELAELGARLIDAPVSGGVRGAVAGTLTVMAGGPDEYVADVTGILQVFGRVVHAGGTGCGHAAKSLNNLISAVHLWATSEAVIAGQNFGIDPDVLLSIINTSTGRSASSENKWPNFIRTGTYNSGFALSLMLKDMRIAVALAGQTDSICLLGEAAVQAWSVSARELPTDADHTEIAKWIMKGIGPR